MLMSWLRLLIASGILLGGCVGEELDLGATEQAAKAQPGDDGGNCPPWACGSNSPEIDFNAFAEGLKVRECVAMKHVKSLINRNINKLLLIIRFIVQNI